MAEDPVKVGLLGLGHMGQNHLRVLSMLNTVQLEFVYDNNPGTLQRLSCQYGIRPSNNLESDLSTIEAAIICTPTSTHFDYFRMAGFHVKNIFIEKPLTSSVKSDQQIVEWAANKGLRVQVGFIERFNPVVQELKRIVGKADVGVINIDFTRTNRLSGRITDVDVITDLMIHDIDLALYLNGPVTRVMTNGMHEGDMIGYAAATLFHANGRFSRVTASRMTEKKMRNVQVTGRDMFIDGELLRKEIIINRQSSIKQDRDNYSIASLEEKVEVRPQEALLSELQAFVAYCRAAPCDVPTALDGLEAMKICEQIQLAIGTHG